jgi:DNA-binding NarL/FixJ family response regulator
MPSTPIRVLMVDDHNPYRLGLRLRLDLEPDLEVVGEAAQGLEAIELAASLQPDVVLMDHNMPGMNGNEATRLLLANQPQIAVLLLSVDTTYLYQARALDNGARAYLSKFTEFSTLLAAIRHAYRCGRTADTQEANRA